MARSVFLTGATGYVGRHVLMELIRKGHETTCLVRSPDAAKRLERDRCAVVVGDLAACADWIATAVRSDAIVHTAFPYGASGEELAVVETAFVRALLQALRLNQSPAQFVYTSSLFLFGARRRCNPFSEHDAPPLDATAWRVRLEQEVLGDDPGQRRNAVIRLGWVFGGDGGTLEHALTSSEAAALPGSRVPLIHVEDAAELYALAVERQCAGLLHACEITPLEWREIGERVSSGRPAAAAPQVDSDLFGCDRPAAPLASLAIGWTPHRRFTRYFEPGISEGAEE